MHSSASLWLLRGRGLNVVIRPCNTMCRILSLGLFFKVFSLLKTLSWTKTRPVFNSLLSLLSSLNSVFRSKTTYFKESNVNVLQSYKTQAQIFWNSKIKITNMYWFFFFSKMTFLLCCKNACSMRFVCPHRVKSKDILFQKISCSIVEVEVHST